MHTRSYLIIAAVFVALVLGSVACTRDRPTEPIDSWTPALKTPSVELSTPTVITPTTSISPTIPALTTVVLVQPTLAAKPSATPTPSVSGQSTPTPWHWYTVRQGDTLYSIALRFNTSIKTLKRLNELTETTIYVGQKLKVPGAASGGESGTREYIVKPGDTLFSIAKRFGVDLQELARINHIVDPSTIYVGQKLIIPAGAAPPVQKLYRVQPGDTLSAIAVRFGVSMQAIMDANHITDPDAIYVGQVLRIP